MSSARSIMLMSAFLEKTTCGHWWTLSYFSSCSHSFPEKNEETPIRCTRRWSLVSTSNPLEIRWVFILEQRCPDLTILLSISEILGRQIACVRAIRNKFRNKSKIAWIFYALWLVQKTPPQNWQQSQLDHSSTPPPISVFFTSFYIESSLIWLLVISSYVLICCCFCLDLACTTVEKGLL